MDRIWRLRPGIGFSKRHLSHSGGATLLAVRGAVRVCLVLAALLLGVVFAQSAAAAKSPRPVVWHLKWKVRTSLDLEGVRAGRYVFLGAPPQYEGKGVLLVDLLTGKKVHVVAPQQECGNSAEPLAIGGGQLMFMCGYGALLYSIRTGQWRLFDSRPGEKKVCRDPCYLQPARVGSHWIEYSIKGGQGQCTQCPNGVAFENLATGAWRHTTPRDVSVRPPISWVTMPGLGPSTRLDLNSPSLISPVCTPVHVPHHGRLVASAHLDAFFSPVVRYGQYEIIGNPYAGGYVGYLQRCGAPTRLRIPYPEDGNSRIIVWSSYTDHHALAGMFLRTGQKFTANSPKAIPAGYATFWLLGKYVLAFGGAGEPTWEAKLPRSAQGSGVSDLTWPT